tara:strand:+ start:8362 stop:8631 length:270 start_codon:yes stop_codon:yes gene_type:complete
LIIDTPPTLLAGFFHAQLKLLPPSEIPSPDITNPMPKTQTENKPPDNNGNNCCCCFPDDDPEELGDQIAHLTLREAVELIKYLDHFLPR